MKRIGLYVLVLFSLLVLSLAVSAQAETVVMVYMTGSTLESTDNAAGKDLAEMMSVVSPDADVRIVVMAAGAREWKSEIDPAAASVYEVMPSSLKPVRTDPAGNMGAPETLTDFLQWTYDVYPADQYALILWDHGGGPLLGVCFDECYPESDGLDSLSVNELENALRNSPFQTRPLLFIGFDACLMSAFEVASAVSPYAEYMIASQETEPPTGWDYSFLADMHGADSGKAWGDKIIKAYRDYYSGGMEAVTLSCLDLKKFRDVEPQINDFFASLTPAVTTDSYGSYARCRAQVKTFGLSTTSSYDLIDLLDLLNLYREESVCDASGLQKAIEETIVAETAVNTEYANGLSIYYPFDNKASYIKSWSDTYAQLNRGSGYRYFMKNMSDIYLGQALISWRHDYRTLVRKDGGTTDISMDLTKEEAWNVARARMIVMEEAEPGLYQFIYYNTNLKQLDSHLSANYAGEALYLLDESGRAKQGPISYLPVENGFALYGILHFEIDWEKPFDQQKLMTDARLIFRPAENGTYVLSEIMTSDVSPDGLYMPSAIRLDSCEDLEIINFGPVDKPDGIRSLDFQAFYPGIDIPHPDAGMTFAFLPVESAHERFAYIRLTDLQGELICSDVVSLSGSEEHVTD